MVIREEDLVVVEGVSCGPWKVYGKYIASSSNVKIKGFENDLVERDIMSLLMLTLSPATKQCL